MRKYAIARFKVGTLDEFTHLYQVDIIGEEMNSETKYYIIKKILVADDDQIYFISTGNRYGWSWKEDNPSEASFIGFIDRYDPHIMEFPDDDAALLWFKLNY